MGKLQKEDNRNASKARNSFVTKKAEAKLSLLADTFAGSLNGACKVAGRDTLKRMLRIEGLKYTEGLELIYNWENRFMSVNYNLQLLSKPDIDERFKETGSCAFEYVFDRKKSGWKCTRWLGDDAEMKNEYMQRLNNSLIAERIKGLDIAALKIDHTDKSGYFTISCDSLIGSSTWIFIPPIMQLITPDKTECVKFVELFELMADAVVNNAG